MIEKPPSYDLNDRRSDIDSDGSLWTPADALYNAHEFMKGKDIESIIIIFNEKKKGGISCQWRFAGKSGDVLKLLINCLGRIMGWQP